MPISPFGKMLFIQGLGNSLSSRNTSHIEQHILSPLSTQPPEWVLPELGILQCKVIEGTWAKQVPSHLFSLHLPCAPGLCSSPVLQTDCFSSSILLFRDFKSRICLTRARACSFLLARSPAPWNWTLLFHFGNYYIWRLIGLGNKEVIT